MKETIVISLGGSVLVPELPNYEFLLKFKELILKWLKEDKKFIIITGGGKICRNYNFALSKVIKPSNETLDWMGIYATQFNAQFLRLAFEGRASNVILSNPSNIRDYDSDLIIGAGFMPGHSTDTDAVLVAKEIGAKKIINLSSVSYVYSEDPKINPNARKFENISWNEYLSIIPDKWEPGLNIPFDPIASRDAAKNGIEVAFMAGSDLDSLDSYINGESFVGTSIK